MANEYCENCKKAVDTLTYECVQGRTAAGKDVHFCSMSCVKNFQKKHGDVEVLGGGQGPAGKKAGGRVSVEPVKKKGGGLRVVMVAILRRLSVDNDCSFNAESGGGEEIALKCDTVPVVRADLNYHVETLA